jgi:hypothetical protein
LKGFKRSAQWSQTCFREKLGSWLKTLSDHSADSGNIAWWAICSAYSPFIALGVHFATCTSLESSSCSGSRAVSRSAASSSSCGAIPHLRDSERTTGLRPDSGSLEFDVATIAASRTIRW